MPAPSLGELRRQAELEAKRVWLGALGSLGTRGQRREPRVPRGAAWLWSGVTQTHHLLTDVGFAHYLSNSTRSPALPAVGSMLQG